jgi:hypothetical protein
VRLGAVPGSVAAVPEAPLGFVALVPAVGAERRFDALEPDVHAAAASAMTISATVV